MNNRRRVYSRVRLGPEVGVTLLNQRSQMLLQGITAAAGESDRVAHRDPTMFTGEFDDLQR